MEYVDLSGVKVLVVDDEEGARDLIKRLMSGCGAEVLAAGSAGEAMQLIEIERPDILLSGIGMPDVDGYGCCAWFAPVKAPQETSCPLWP